MFCREARTDFRGGGDEERRRPRATEALRHQPRIKGLNSCAPAIDQATATAIPRDFESLHERFGETR